jgi:hypothetical protein
LHLIGSSRKGEKGVIRDIRKKEEAQTRKEGEERTEGKEEAEKRKERE